MITSTLPPRPQSDTTVVPPHAEGSYVDWAAILAGGIFALAISFLLISFGASLGLSLTSPYGGEDVSAACLAIAAGIWFAWVSRGRATLSEVLAHDQPEIASMSMVTLVRSDPARDMAPFRKRHDQSVQFVVG